MSPKEILAKTILNKTRHRDPWFLDDYTLNPWSGCSFNCLFCYIRGSKYGIHMEEKLSLKVNAVELLRKKLKSLSAKGRHGVIVLSSATDPYLQFEEREGITRRLLEVILEYRFPVHIITRSPLVLRDLDLLREIDNNAILPEELKTKTDRGAFITFSFSTLDDKVAGIFEPGAPAPSLRLKGMKEVLSQNFLSGVSLMPLLPWISDTTESLEELFFTFSQDGVKYIFPSTITLFGNDSSDSKQLVFRAIEKYFPHLLDKYIQLFGKSDYLPEYYQSAFTKKAQELMKKYNLKDRIA